MEKEKWFWPLDRIQDAGWNCNDIHLSNKRIKAVPYPEWDQAHETRIKIKSLTHLSREGWWSIAASICNPSFLLCFFSQIRDDACMLCPLFFLSFFFLWWHNLTLYGQALKSYLRMYNLPFYTTIDSSLYRVRVCVTRTMANIDEYEHLLNAMYVWFCPKQHLYIHFSPPTLLGKPFSFTAL